VNKRYALASVKVPDDDSADVFPGTFHVILSTPELDRDGEAIESKAFDPLPDHITFDVDHGMTTETTVGSGTPTYEDDGLLHVRGTWSSLQRAQDVRTLVREKHIRTTSVAYMFAQYEQKDGVPTVTKAELLNGAFVAIPSNRGAVVLSAKAYRAALDDAGPVLAPEGNDVILRRLGELAAQLRTPAAVRASTKVPGMSANDLSQALSATVEDVHGGDRRYTWVRDYGDDWVVFSVDGMEPTGMFRQAFSVSDAIVSLDGDTEEVRSRTIYEPVPTDSTDNAPKSAASAATSSASVVARALALGESALALGRPAGASPITQGG
jgi:prohead serine protease